MNDYGSYCGSHEHVKLSIETRLGQSSYPSQICHFLSRSLGQITENQIIMFVLLKVVIDYKFTATFRAFINIGLSQ